jgi:hypothetical protein
MFDAAREGHCEGIRVRDPRSGLPTLVRSITRPEAIDPRRPFRQVRLRRVFQVGDAAFVPLLGHPAFVADMAVAATLVKRGEDPLDLGRAAPRRGQPGTLSTVGIDIGHGIGRADLRQPGPPGLEPPDHVERRVRRLRIIRTIDRAAGRVTSSTAAVIRRRSDGLNPAVQRLAHLRSERPPPVPAGNFLLPEICGILRLASRLDALPERIRVGCAAQSRVALGPVSPLRFVRTGPKLVHTASIPPRRGG